MRDEMCRGAEVDADTGVAVLVSADGDAKGRDCDMSEKD